MTGRRNKEEEDKLFKRPSRERTKIVKTIPIQEKPEPPSRLSESAQEEWDRLIRNVGNVIHPQDLGLLEAICRAWGYYQDLSDIIRAKGYITETPNGMEIISPYVTEARKQLEVYTRLVKEFGVTPFARLRISDTNKEKDKPKDPMEELLKELG